MARYIVEFLADTWNALRREHRRNRPMPGLGVRLLRTVNGCVVSIAADNQFHHPWELTPIWANDPTGKLPLGGQWTTQVRPGLVDGKDVTIDVTAVPASGGPAVTQTLNLTDETPPALVLTSWRDPIASAGITSDGSGNLITLPGAGYPAFFSAFVRPKDTGSAAAAAAGVGVAPANQPTGYLLACDIYLTMPRLASTAQQVTVLDPETDSQSISIQTVFRPTVDGPSRAWLSASAQWTSPVEPTAQDALLGTAVQPQTDEILIATLWMVSPQNPTHTDAPDGTWTPYPQYSVFWNMNHAALNIAPGAPPDPITFPYTESLADGLGQNVINRLLDPINDESQQIAAYLGAANFAGEYWTV